MFRSRESLSADVKPIIGWDIGGAHLKAVQLDASGTPVQVLQLPCPLWRGLNQLEIAIKNVLQTFKIEPSEALHAITMTGELVDLFDNRHVGVCEITKVAGNLLGENIWFYAADTGEIERQPNFVRQYDVHRFTSLIASANWHASASALAIHVQDALLVDIGSTTTDIITIKSGKVICSGLSDAYRLATDSLVYTGVVRTPIMALAQKLPFEDGEINVAAEYFATMADVYRLTGELTQDDAETADGKFKTQLESARRLARMIGHDVDKSLTKWIKLAFACKSLQMSQIKTAVLKHLKPNMTIIGAGAGSFLVKQIAADLNCTYQPISMRFTKDINVAMQQDLEVCFPAYAVAYLLRQHA
ncbi:MAG: hypothetical protein H7Z20_05525 [Bdellovibrio sp.]|nr:hypothetical protein [Methylotenera sp.]